MCWVLRACKMCFTSLGFKGVFLGGGFLPFSALIVVLERDWWLLLLMAWLVFLFVESMLYFISRFVAFWSCWGSGLWPCWWAPVQGYFWSLPLDVGLPASSLAEPYHDISWRAADGDKHRCDIFRASVDTSINSISRMLWPRRRQRR